MDKRRYNDGERFLLLIAFFAIGAIIINRIAKEKKGKRNAENGGGTPLPDNYLKWEQGGFEYFRCLDSGAMSRRKPGSRQLEIVGGDAHTASAASGIKTTIGQLLAQERKL